MQKLPIGLSDFRSLREGDRYYVDKSLFIKEIINIDADILLIPRPRRFGKTLNLSMLRYFFEKVENTEDIKNLFKGLAIEKEKEFENHCCKHPVIFLTFKDVKQLNFDDAYEVVTRLISREFERHSYLLRSDILTTKETQDFNNIVSLEASRASFEESIRNLSNYLFRYYRQPLIILIDEYDTPIHTAYSEGYYREMIAFMRGFLGAGLKDNTNIYKSVLTGILRVARESIFSGMNNLGVYTIISHKLATYFGLTEEEVIKIVEDFNEQDKLDTIKLWYNGYDFGGVTIYNPWSILNYIANVEDGPKAYWANTSSNRIIKDLLSESPETVRSEFQDLLQDIPITKSLDENIVFDELTKDDVNIYSFLLFSGYLKAFDRQNIGHKTYYSLLIPNLEVKQIFENIIIKWIKASYEDRRLQMLLKALLENDIETFEEILSEFVLETLSYFDTQKRDVERVYQAFILGLLVNLSSTHTIQSNKESGYGRYDVSIIPKDPTKRAVIMELKKIRLNETKDTALTNALKQIEDKKYETEILKKGITNISKLAVVFDGKRVWVKEG